MKICFVSEYTRKDGKLYYVDELAGILDLAVQNHEPFVLHTHEKNLKGPIFSAMNVKTREVEEINITNFDFVYFGALGKEIEAIGEVNGLIMQLPEFCKTFEHLKKYESVNGLKFVNSSVAIIHNLSKDYLIEFGGSGKIKTIETKRVKSIDGLFELKNSPRKMIIKPLISERAVGTKIVNNMTDEEIIQYCQKFLGVQNFDNQFYGRTMARQGIIAQPYISEIGLFGETKIAVVDGEITLARKNNSGGSSDIVLFNEDRLELVQPTEEESNLVKTAFREYNKIYPIHFMRVDIVGAPGNMMVSEIEAINPSFAIDCSVFSEEQVNAHYKKILSFAD